MATNLSALVTATTKATALSDLVLAVVSPQLTVGYQPQNPPNDDGTPTIAQNPPSFLFHCEGENSSQLESDITDHFVEDNTAINDQIALRSELVTTQGFIGELNDIPPRALQPVKTIADKLTVISAYAPQASVSAQVAYAEAFQLYQVTRNAARSAVAAWSSIGNAVTGDNGESIVGSDGLALAANQNRQQTAYQLFYGYWRRKTLFTVQTPWAVFQNMAIKSMRAVQDAETRMVTTFELTFKIIRTASTITVNADGSLSGHAAAQAAALDDQGTSTPVESTPILDALNQIGA